VRAGFGGGVQLSEADVSQFDRMYTAAPLRDDSPVSPTSPLSPSAQAKFAGFSYGSAGGSGGAAPWGRLVRAPTLTGLHWDGHSAHDLASLAAAAESPRGSVAAAAAAAANSALLSPSGIPDPAPADGATTRRRLSFGPTAA
jgi:hypothetical protein